MADEMAHLPVKWIENREIMQQETNADNNQQEGNAQQGKIEITPDTGFRLHTLIARLPIQWVDYNHCSRSGNDKQKVRGTPRTC